jgi:DNA polymerase
MSGLELDLETRGEVNLLTAGPYRYAMHRSADVLIASYRINHGPWKRWKRGEPCPQDIIDHVTSGDTISCHNSSFERLMWWFVLSPKYGWPKPRIDQFRCTATTAAALSLPRSLDRLGEALNLKQKKDKRGKALMKIHSIPIGFNDDGSAIWHELVDDPASMEEYHAYCDDDVKTEAEADTRMVPLSDAEQAVFVLSETINDRGIRIDVDSAIAALEIADKAKERINAELGFITGGAVRAVTEVAKMKRWIEAQGVTMPSMDKDDVEEFLFEVDDLPENVRRVLELRQEGAKPSVEKIASMLARVCDDGRARGVYLCHGAGQTGRFSSRGLQAHNMPKYRKEFEEAHLRLDILFETIRTGEPAALEFMYGPKLGRPLHILSDAVRSFLWAAPGHEFINADFTSIEGVMAAWFAKEDWKLQAFRDLLAGTGPGMYELLAAGIYNVDVADVTKPQRSTGKVGELSMGYQGGVGALAKMARQNKLKLHTIFPGLWETATDERQAQVEKNYEKAMNRHDATAMRLGREGWLAGELVKLGWREKHPMISDYEDGAWAQLNTACYDAVANPGTVTQALFGRVHYTVKNGFLWCLLPSGRCLAYGRPKIMELDAPWADKTLEPRQREKMMSVTALGVDPQTEKWVRSSLYGGKLFNNVVQGSARDILVHGMQTAESAGYPIVLHTHDECMAELPVGQGDVTEFEDLICILPGWADGIPLKASGWKGKRYRKD